MESPILALLLHMDIIYKYIYIYIYVYVCIILGLPNTSGKNGIIYNFWLGTFTLLGGSKSGRKTDPTGTERSMAQWPCNRNRFIVGTYHI